jgi:hypothetical protein
MYLTYFRYNLEPLCIWKFVVWIIVTVSDLCTLPNVFLCMYANIWKGRIFMKIHVASWMGDRYISSIVPHTSLITWLVSRVTRWVPHVEQDQPTLPQNLSSPSVFSCVSVTRSLVFCVMFYRSLFVSLSFFLFAIVLSVLRFTASDYTFGILDLQLLITPLVS